MSVLAIVFGTLCIYLMEIRAYLQNFPYKILMSMNYTAPESLFSPGLWCGKMAADDQ